LTTRIIRNGTNCQFACFGFLIIKELFIIEWRNEELDRHIFDDLKFPYQLNYSIIEIIQASMDVDLNIVDPSLLHMVFVDIQANDESTAAIMSCGRMI
jgi:hypothetical protein